MLVPDKQVRITPATQTGRTRNRAGTPEQVFANVADVVFWIWVLRRFDQMVVGPERGGSRRLDELRRCPNDRPSTTNDVVLKQPRPRHAQPHHPSLQPRLEAVLLLRFHVEPRQQNAHMREFYFWSGICWPTTSPVSNNTSLRILGLDPNCGLDRSR